MIVVIVDDDDDVGDCGVDDDDVIDVADIVVCMVVYGGCEGGCVGVEVDDVDHVGDVGCKGNCWCVDCWNIIKCISNSSNSNCCYCCCC